MKLYMFRTVPLSIIKSSHCTRNKTCRFADSRLSGDLYDIYHCCVYSENVIYDNTFHLRHFEVTGRKFAKELGLENYITMSGFLS